MNRSRKSLLSRVGKENTIPLNGTRLKQQAAAEQSQHIKNIAALRRQLDSKKDTIQRLTSLNQRLQKHLETSAPQPTQLNDTIKRLTAELEAERAKNKTMAEQLHSANAACNTAKKQAEYEQQKTRHCQRRYVHLARKYNGLCAQTAGKQLPEVDPFGSMDSEIIAELTEAISRDLATATDQQLGLKLGLKGSALSDDPVNPLEIFQDPSS